MRLSASFPTKCFNSARRSESVSCRRSLHVDGEKFAGEFLFVEILNLSFTGPALPLAFHASPDDGLFDVVFLEAKNRKPMLSWLGDNPENAPPPLTVLQGRKVKMVWHGGHLRIDSRVFLPPKKPVDVSVTLEKQNLETRLRSDLETVLDSHSGPRARCAEI